MRGKMNHKITIKKESDGILRLNLDNLIEFGFTFAQAREMIRTMKKLMRVKEENT